MLIILLDVDRLILQVPSRPITNAINSNKLLISNGTGGTGKSRKRTLWTYR
ncbi:unnamed protein product [Amoebophrya sp. A120]|nr:unnamed protein product [Amoebophrya sp. A120]|eukprot:GSA120T00000487001.1